MQEDSIIGKNWKSSERKYSVTVESDVKIPARDGTLLNADIFRPSDFGKFPALLGIHPYLPTQSPPIHSKANSTSAGGWAASVEKPNSTMEAGDPEFYVRRGYVHVICNVRGTDLSEGKYDFVGQKEVEDAYDVIEWTALQPWCDGNVGMFGISYFAWIQQFTAALKPPHLKCLFCPYAATDFYRDVVYHGGILSLWALNWKKLLFKLKPRSITCDKIGSAKFQEAVSQALQDDDLALSPKAEAALKDPLQPDNMLTADLLLHPYDDDFWEERKVKLDQIDVPVYLGADWGIYGLHLPGTFRSWENIGSKKKMTVGPPVNLDRPVYQFQYESLRWFDYWLKGIDTKIMDEPPINLFVVGSGLWKKTMEWPLPETMWTPFNLHEGSLLSEHEFWPNEPFDTYEDSPWGRGYVEYLTPPLVEKTEVIGPIVLNLFGSTTDNEILWFASLRDVAPEGKDSTILTRGWLRGSQREVDLSRSKPWQPYHTHKKRSPLNPNEICEFKISLIPTACLFHEGHMIALRISSVDDHPKNTFEAIASEHIRRQKPSRISVYHDSNHPSNILLPVTSGNVIGTFMSGGKVTAVQ